MNEAFLEVRGVSKNYGGIPALADVSMELHAGQIHALMGENGAGKSTLIKILAGTVKPDSGSIWISGTKLSLGSVAASERAGIATIHQESTAFPNMSVEDNVFAAQEPRRAGGLLLDRARMRLETQAHLAELGLEGLNSRLPVGELPLATRQLVAMARALSRDSRVLILDEPTASLSTRETDALFANIRRLRDDGVAILYVSHRMDEIFALATSVTILRDGKYVDSVATADITRPELIRKMVGRELLDGEPDEHTRTPGDTILDVQNLTRAGAFSDISFSLRAGEIVGLAGLVGAGRTEVAEAIFGASTYDTGSIIVKQKPLPKGRIAKSIASGLALVPEDRQNQGLVLPLPVSSNLSLIKLRNLCRLGFRSAKRERDTVATLITQMQIRVASPILPVQSLSGGNQQKVVIGKWLAQTPTVLLLDEPTRGVDVGAKSEIYKLIRRFAAQGMATLMISSELPELIALCDRIIVMRSGIISGELDRASASEEAILALALGDSSTEVKN